MWFNPVCVCMCVQGLYRYIQDKQVESVKQYGWQITGGRYRANCFLTACGACIERLAYRISPRLTLSLSLSLSTPISNSQQWY